MNLKIRGKTWELVRVPRGRPLLSRNRKEKRLGTHDLGVCEAPDLRGKRIAVRDGLAPEVELETVIHESLHAAFWDIDEEAIRETAMDLSRILWRLGWRLPG